MLGRHVRTHPRRHVGGFCLGSYWSFVTPAEHISALSIPILEFLGVVFNFVTFAPVMQRMISGNPNASIVLRTDALTAALTLPRESQRQPSLVAAYQWLRADLPEFAQLAPHCMVAHMFSDANSFSDEGSGASSASCASRWVSSPWQSLSPTNPTYQVYDLAARLTHQRSPSSIFHAGRFLDKRFPAKASVSRPAGEGASSPRPTQTQIWPGGFVSRRFLQP